MSDERLAALSRQILQARLDEKRSAQIEADLQAARRAMYEHRQGVDKLAENVRQWQRYVGEAPAGTLSGMVMGLIRGKHHVTEEDRQNLRLARQAYEQASGELEILQDEVDELDRQLTVIGNPRQRYEQLVGQKEELIRAAYPDKAARLVEASKQSEAIEAEERRLADVLANGDTVLNGLRTILGALGSAGKWGAWDIVAGGAMASHIKHTKVETARSLMDRLDADMVRFQRQVHDLGFVEPERLRVVDIGGLARFGDIFFDNIVVDLVVQKRIAKVREEVATAMEGVGEIVAELRARRNTLRDRLDERHQERRHLIERL